LTVIPFKAEHLQELQLQTAQAVLQSEMTPAYAESLEKSGPAFSGIVDGKVIASSGIVEVWEGRGTAWALFSQTAIINRRDMVALRRVMRDFLQFSPILRIECYVDCSFTVAHHFAESLGFELECKRMRAFNPGGTDCSLYSRIKEAV
jgi:hypothetical protein